MKICQICSIDYTVQHLLLPLINEMQYQGWDITIVCSEGKLANNLKKHGYKFNFLEINRSYNIFKGIKSILELIKYFNKNKFDIIHVHTPIVALLVRISSLFHSNKKIIYTVHGFYFHDQQSFLKKYFFIFLEKIVANRTEYLFCQSMEDVKTCETYKIMPSRKVLYIGNGVNTEIFNTTNSNFNYNNRNKYFDIKINPFIICIIGRQVKEKGYLELFEAIDNLNKKYSNIYLLMVGGTTLNEHNSSIKNELFKIKKKYGKKIIDLNFRNDIPFILSMSDIYCLPSYREGMPRSIIEAMMMGKAVIASDIRGCREEVVHNETGILVPSKDPKALELAIEQLYNNKENMYKMGINGRNRALHFYDEKYVLKLQIDHFKNNY